MHCCIAFQFCKNRWFCVVRIQILSIDDTQTLVKYRALGIAGFFAPAPARLFTRIDQYFVKGSRCKTPVFVYNENIEAPDNRFSLLLRRAIEGAIKWCRMVRSQDPAGFPAEIGVSF